MERNNAFSLGKLFLWIDIGFINSLGFGTFVSVAQKPKSIQKRFLAGYLLYVLQLFSVEFTRAYFSLQRNGGII